MFGSSVTVLKAEDFSEVEKIDLELPGGLPMENLGLGGLIEALSDPEQRVSIFNYSDPIVHNRVFGLARFDLNKRKFDFTPIRSVAVLGGWIAHHARQEDGLHRVDQWHRRQSPV